MQWLRLTSEKKKKEWTTYFFFWVQPCPVVPRIPGRQCEGTCMQILLLGMLSILFSYKENDRLWYVLTIFLLTDNAHKSLDSSHVTLEV